MMSLCQMPVRIGAESSNSRADADATDAALGKYRHHRKIMLVSVRAFDEYLGMTRIG